MTAAGTLLESSTGTVTLCTQPVAMGTAGEGTSSVGCAEHTMVEVTGLDVHSLPGHQEIDSWVSSYVRVNGTWSDGTIAASSAETTEPPQGPGRRTVPCPTPPDGWPGAAPSTASDDPVSRLEATITHSPDVYSGLWVASIGENDETALVVGTVGDVDTTRDELSAIFPYNLCVIAVDFSLVELQSAEHGLETVGRTWQSVIDPTIDRVRVTTAVLDASTAEALAPYADQIVVDVTVIHAR